MYTCTNILYRFNFNMHTLVVSVHEKGTGWASGVRFPELPAGRDPYTQTVKQIHRTVYTYSRHVCTDLDEMLESCMALL